MISLLNSPAELKQSLAIVACDAGAANIIARWISQLVVPFKIYVEGPARSIFAKVCPEIAVEDTLQNAIENSEILLSGTGWSSSLEHDARILARQQGLQVLAVIDHWVNYLERFTRRGEIVLPDMVIVTDEDAKCEADRTFSHRPILQWSNDYLREEVSHIKTLRQQEVQNPAQNILMVMEPIRHDWAGEAPGEFLAAHYFLQNAVQLPFLSRKICVRIRPHPSDIPGKYVEFIQQYAALNVMISEQFSLAEDIAWADIVVGCESFALVVALEAGVPVVSMLPPQAPQCRLPQQAIQHLKDIITE